MILFDHPPRLPRENEITDNHKHNQTNEKEKSKRNRYAFYHTFFFVFYGFEQ